jgi:hypothetical protein
MEIGIDHFGTTRMLVQYRTRKELDCTDPKLDRAILATAAWQQKTAKQAHNILSLHIVPTGKPSPAHNILIHCVCTSETACCMHLHDLWKLTKPMNQNSKPSTVATWTYFSSGRWTFSLGRTLRILRSGTTTL